MRLENCVKVLAKTCDLKKQRVETQLFSKFFFVGGFDKNRLLALGMTNMEKLTREGPQLSNCF